MSRRKFEILEGDQGTPEWFAARTGIPTASNFDRIVTASGRPSTQGDDYRAELIGEWVTGEKKYIPPSYWMQRGTEMEPQARAAYEFITGYTVDEVSFLFRDKDRMVGCSPDGLVRAKPKLVPGWGVEIKCPSPIEHNAYYYQGVCPKKYLPQVQGSMWVTGFKRWDFMSFHPDYDPLIVTVERDDEWMKAFDKLIPVFVQHLVDARKDPRVIAQRERRLAQEAA